MKQITATTKFALAMTDRGDKYHATTRRSQSVCGERVASLTTVRGDVHDIARKFAEYRASERFASVPCIKCEEAVAEIRASL